MADYNEDFFFDPGITIKQEPAAGDNGLCSSASVPIPGRRQLIINDLQDIQYTLDSAPSPSYQSLNIGEQLLPPYEPILNNTMWGSKDDESLTKQECMNMDDYEIFDVDKSDLIQDASLVEINANDDLLDLNFDDLLLPEETPPCNGTPVPQVQQKYIPFPTLSNNNFSNNVFLASSCPSGGIGFYRDSMDFTNSDSSNQFTNITYSPSHTPTSPLRNRLLPGQANTPPKKSTLHELLSKQTPESPVLGQSNSTSPTVNPLIAARLGKPFNSRLSSSAPTNSGLEHIWQRREPRKHLLSTGSLAEAGSTSSLSTGGVLSPEAHDLSHDDQDYEEDSDHYEDFSSDDGDSDDDDEHTKQTKKERYFWQYNVQAKGPKGQRLVMKTKMENPHVLNEITDPVFSTECVVRGIKHSGKARKGDGNDLTPNPRKLYNIGKELDKLGRVINDMTPVSELPFNIRPKSRKEKNKLASRACRLKKKAQHEANKIKLHGLENEHKRLMSGIYQIKQLLGVKISSPLETQDEITNNIDKVAKAAAMPDRTFGESKIAGQTTDYVNNVLDKVKEGVPAGGLDDV